MPQWLPKYHNYWVQLYASHCPRLPRSLTNPISILEVITVVLWLMSFSFLIWECQAWDGAQDAINDVFSQESEELNFVSALPNQDSAILGLRVATGLTCINWILFGVTLIMSSKFKSSLSTSNLDEGIAQYYRPTLTHLLAL